MATHRIRVVPRGSHRGVVGTAALIGALGGIGMSLLLLLDGATGFISPWVALLLILGGPTVAVALIPHVTQRWGRVVAAAVCCWAAFHYFSAVTMFIVPPASVLVTMDSGTMFSHLVSLLTFTAAATGIGAALGAGALVTTRLLLFRIVEQDGLLCWRCGYDTSSPKVRVCPECGTAVDPRRYRWTWLHRVVAAGRRVGWRTCLTLGAIGVVMVGLTWRSGAASPITRFAERMQQFGPLEPGFVLEIGGSPFTGGTASVQIRTSLDANQRLDLLVVHVPARTDGIVMQLQVAQTPKTTATWSGSYSSSMGLVPCLLCDLNAAQAEAVMRDGVPESLKAAMLQAAAGVSWTGVPAGSPIPPNIGVDAGPHFDAGAR